MDANRHTEPKKAAMLEALAESLGVVSEAVKTVGIARSTHYLWMNEDPVYKEAVEELNDAVIDFAENRLHKLIEKGDTAATIFLLKTKGKKRGYVERSEQEISGGLNISWHEEKTYETK